MLLWINFEVQHELNLSITFLGGAVDIALRDASPVGDDTGFVTAFSPARDVVGMK